jgi:hypothetical protein
VSNAAWFIAQSSRLLSFHKGDLRETGAIVLSPLQGSVIRLARNPRLTPWAAFQRRFAAERQAAKREEGEDGAKSGGKLRRNGRGRLFLDLGKGEQQVPPYLHFAALSVERRNDKRCGGT